MGAYFADFVSLTLAVVSGAAAGKLIDENPLVPTWSVDYLGRYLKKRGWSKEETAWAQVTVSCAAVVGALALYNNSPVHALMAAVYLRPMPDFYVAGLLWHMESIQQGLKVIV
jgi:hypothetical protein